MFTLGALVLLSLISVGHSSPVICERLVHPLEQLQSGHVEGRWALVAGSLDHQKSMEALQQRDSITMYFSNSSEGSSVAYTQVNRFSDACQHLRYNISVQGSSFRFDVENRFQLSGSFLSTSCPDCLVMRWRVESQRRTSSDLYLLSRRREVEPKVMEEFRAQLGCLQLPAPVVMDATEELCPEDSESRPEAAAAAAPESAASSSQN